MWVKSEKEIDDISSMHIRKDFMLLSSCDRCYTWLRWVKKIQHETGIHHTSTVPFYKKPHI